MTEYSFEQLNALKDSSLVSCPEFVYKEEIETVPAGTHFQEHSTNWRRGSHSTKRQPVMPNAAIPFSQKSLFDTGKPDEKSSAVEDTTTGDADDDEYAAQFLLRSKQKPVKKTQEVDEDGAQVVNLSYAAALAATMKMSEAPSEQAEGAAAADDDDGWVSVATTKPRRNRNKGGSFSKWRSS